MIIISPIEKEVPKINRTNPLNIVGIRISVDLSTYMDILLKRNSNELGNWDANGRI